MRSLSVYWDQVPGFHFNPTSHGQSRTCTIPNFSGKLAVGQQSVGRTVRTWRGAVQAFLMLVASSVVGSRNPVSAEWTCISQVTLPTQCCRSPPSKA